MGTTTANGLPAIATSASMFGGNTSSLTNRSTPFVGNYKNGEGKVGQGTVIARTRQSDELTPVEHVLENEAMMAWGDPHLDNAKSSEDGKKAISESPDAVLQDAKGSKPGKEQLFTDAETVSRANVNEKEGTLIGSVEADIELRRSADAKSDLDVEKSHFAIALNKVDLTVTDANGQSVVLTLGEAWGGRGSNGKASVTNTTNRTEGRAPQGEDKGQPVFCEQSGVIGSYKNRFYGAGKGSNPDATVLTSRCESYDKAVIQQDQKSMLDFSQDLRSANDSPNTAVTRT